MGARAQAMGNASAALSDVWSITHNMAGLAKTEGATAGFSYDALPSAPFFNRMAAVVAVPVKPGVAGIGMFRFGDDLYNEQVLSAGFANTFGLASLGVRLNYLQYQVNGLGTTTALTASFGGIATITPELLFGAHILNINQPIIDESTEERVPTKLHASIAFVPSEKLIAAAEIEKDLRYRAMIKAGVEYEAFRKIIFRSGVHLHPQAAFFGLGFRPRRFTLDYAVQIDRPLGLTHQATVTYQFKKR